VRYQFCATCANHQENPQACDDCENGDNYDEIEAHQRRSHVTVHKTTKVIDLGPGLQSGGHHPPNSTRHEGRHMNLQKWPIERVLPYENNVKKHPPAQVAGIANSIKQFGWDQPIVVDKDGVIIKGHGRRLAAISLGYKEVPVLVRDDLTPEQVRAARLADNRAAMSDIDTELLRLELADMNSELLKGIFDDKELEFTLADLGSMNVGAFVPDLDRAVDEQQKQTASKAEALKTARIPLKKAFGFDSIAGCDEIYLSRFFARIEKETGLKGEAAFVTYIKGVVGEVSQP
jgi:hypothetical protein